jgi:outer membrane receptor protein involved in Fe transport
MDTGADGTPPAEEEEEYEEEEEEVVVVTATRTPQKIEEAPSIISVVTRDNMLTMGYLSLGEVLRNTVGFGMNDNGHWPDTGVRGINGSTTYGDKLQMLIDGHNMSWRQFNRNYHNPSWVAMDDIQRIEIIRGPGAALWGANALAGVINIVTRDWSHLDGAEVTLGADHRLDSQFVSARVGKMLTDDFSVFASVSYYNDNADSLMAHFREFDLKNGDIIRVGNDVESGVTFNVKAKYNWFKLSFHKSRHDTQAPLSTFSIIGGDDSRFITDRHIVRLSFEKMLFTGFEINADFAYDDMAFDDGTAYEGNPGSIIRGDPATGKAVDPAVSAKARFLRQMAAADRRYEMKVTATYLPTPNIQALAGVELEYLDLIRWHFPEVWAANTKTVNGLPVPDPLPAPEFSNIHLGSFIQGQYSPIDMLGITAGVRVDYDQIYGTIATPRAGVVVRLPAGFYAKGLFGMAYKAPSFHDLYYFSKDAFYGNPNLSPEKSMTAEGQLGYRLAGKLDIRLTGFWVKIDDLIGYASKTRDKALEGQDEFPESQRPVSDPKLTYSQKVNKEYVTSAGIEGELEILPIDRLKIRLQGTYRAPQDSEGERLLYSSNWTMGGSITLRLHTKLFATVRGLGVGQKKVPNRQLTEAGYRQWAKEYDPTIDAPAYFTGTFVLRASDVFQKGLSLFLKLDNFTNTEYWDAGRELLYPQKKFQGMVWAKMAL